MRASSLKSVLPLLALFALLAARADAAGASLVVRVSGFRNTQGQALFHLYDSKAAWLKRDKALRTVSVPISGDTVEVTLEDVPPGVYALSVTHDENANGKFDMHWLPLPGPDEGAGVSNNAAATLGPPSFDDSRFQLGAEGHSLRIRMRY